MKYLGLGRITKHGTPLAHRLLAQNGVNTIRVLKCEQCLVQSWIISCVENENGFEKTGGWKFNHVFSCREPIPITNPVI